MKFPSLKRLALPRLLLFLLALGTLANASPQQENGGALVVLVTWGDVENTPAKNVYVEAHGFVKKDNEYKSFVLKMVRDGRYEISLPQGVYDVFVSDGGSEPRCRRMRVGSGGGGTWTLKLEVDDVYTNR